MMTEHMIEILLVEDNPSDAVMFFHAMKENNFTNRIEWLHDGEEALDFLFATGAFAGRDTNHAPKVILLDLKLPKVDGLEVLERIKGDPRTRAIPVVVMTSSQEESDIVKSYNLGVNSYIVKPLDFHQFVETARALGMYWTLLNQPPLF